MVELDSHPTLSACTKHLRSRTYFTAILYEVVVNYQGTKRWCGYTALHRYLLLRYAIVSEGVLPIEEVHIHHAVLAFDACPPYKK